jgi:hypothetical protein
MLGESKAPIVVIHRGVMTRGQTMAEYYTSQPAPTQWIAVGFVSTQKIPPQLSPHLPWLLVGTGRTEDTAINDLWERLGRTGHDALGDQLIGV